MEAAAIDTDDEIRVRQQRARLLERFDVFEPGGWASAQLRHGGENLRTWNWPLNHRSDLVARGLNYVVS